jgi:hypothetical protein
MDDRELIRTVLRRLSRRLRLVRAVTAANRFLVVGLLLALVPLLAKGILPAFATWVAAGLIAGLAILGLLYGSLLRARPAHIARLADRRLGLKERMTCAVEHLASRDPADIVQAQLAETASRIRTIRPRDAFLFRLTPEMRIAGPRRARLGAGIAPRSRCACRSGAKRLLSRRSTSPRLRRRPLEQKLAAPAAQGDVPEDRRADRSARPPSSTTSRGLRHLSRPKMSQQRPISRLRQTRRRALKMLARMPFRTSGATLPRARTRS